MGRCWAGRACPLRPRPWRVSRLRIYGVSRTDPAPGSGTWGLPMPWPCGTLTRGGCGQPTQDSGYLIRCARRGLERIFRAGFAYQKAGVLLPDLVPTGLEQGLLFAAEPDDGGRADRLMEVLDAINRTLGRQAVRYASETVSDRWRMRARLKSPASTTRWDELPTVLAN